MKFARFLSLMTFASASKSGKNITTNHIDESTYANLDQIASTHIFLNFSVDFDAKQFVGTVEHTLDCLKSTDTVIMDYVGIDVSAVERQGQGAEFWQPITFETHTDLNPNLGNALEMTLPRGKKFSHFI